MKETDDVGDTEKSYTWTTEEYGDLVSEYGDGDSSYYEYDALGNTAALLDPAQTSTDKFLYRAFGKLEARSGESDVDHTFVGKQGYLYNAESELYLLGTGGSGGASSSARTSSTIGRYYDADVGQFLTQDPARTPEKNLYRYVDNNPVNQVDPSGQAVGSADVFEDQFNWYSDWHDRNYQRDTHKLIHVERPYSEHLLFYDAKSVRLASGGKCNHFVYKYVGDTSWYRKPFSSNSFARTLRLKGGQEVRTIVKARVIRDAVDDQAWGEVDDLVKKWDARGLDSMDKWWARRTGVSVDDLDLREKSGWVGGAIKGVTKLYGALFGWPLILAKYAACAALKPLGMPGLCELINGLTTCKDIIKGAVAEAYQMMGALFFSSNEVLNTLFTGMKQGFESFAGNFLANVTEALKTLMGAEDFDFSVWTRVFAGLLKNPKNIDFSAMLTAVGETLGFNYKTLYEGITASSGLSGALGFILSAAAAVKKFVANKPQEALELIKSLIPAPLTDMFTLLKDDLWGTVVQNLTDFAVGAIPEMITAIAKKIVPGYGWLTIAFDFLKGFVAACQGLGTLFTTFARGVKDASKSSENVVGAIKTSTETALQGVLVPLAVFAITAAGAKNLFQLGRNAFKKLINTGKTILTKVISAIWNPIRGLVQRAGAFFGFNDDALVFSQPATSDGYTVNVSIRGKKQPPGGRAKPLPATGNLEDLVMVSKSPSQPYSELDDDCKKKVTNEWAAVKTAYGKVYGAGPSNDTSADYPALVAAVKALAKAIAKHCSSCRNRQFNHTAKPPGGGSWINYIKTKCGGSEQGVDRPHGHHIVLKGTRFSQSAIAREILCEVGINPYIVNEKLDKRIGCANLIIATNCCHTTAYANATLRELLQVRGNQDGVVSALERLGYDFGRGRWGKERNAANANDECCENKNNG